MKTVYTITDGQGRLMSAEVEDGHVRVTMNFFVGEDLTVDEVFETLGWTITRKQTFEKPKVVPLTKRNDNGNQTET